MKYVMATFQWTDKLVTTMFAMNDIWLDNPKILYFNSPNIYHQHCRYVTLFRMTFNQRSDFMIMFVLNVRRGRFYDLYTHPYIHLYLYTCIVNLDPFMWLRKEIRKCTGTRCEACTQYIVNKSGKNIVFCCFF